VLEQLRSGLADYEQYRRVDVPLLEVSPIYGLYPETLDTAITAELVWPQPYPHADRNGVYLIFGEGGHLLYVGKASMRHSLGHRLGHYFCYDKPARACRIIHDGWSRPPRYIVTIAVPKEMGFEAAALEEFLIDRLNPSDNRKGVSGR
jgi:hypothetical protein